MNQSSPYRLAVCRSAAGRAGDLYALEEHGFGVAQLAFGGLGEVAVVNQKAELKVGILSAPGEVGTGDEQEPVVDRNELRVVADLAAVEGLCPQYDGWYQMQRDFVGSRG